MALELQTDIRYLKGVGGKGRCAAATLGAILCAVRIDFRLLP